ncbi:YfcC family protein [Vibrio parahaemolyticus]
MPDSYVILFSMLILAALATYIFPAGEYQRIAEGGRTLVDPNSFTFLDSQPISLIDFFMSIQQGMIKGANIIFLVLIIGGSFAVFDSSLALQTSIMQLINRSKGHKYALVCTVSVAFSIAGFIGALQTAIIAFVPIGIIIAKALKLDAIAGIAIVYLGAYAGYTIGGLDPITTGIAQTIAGLPLFSGLGFRFAIYIVILLTTVIYICNYIKKISDNPKMSILNDNPFPAKISELDISIPDKLTNLHKILLGYFVICMGGYIYCVFESGWGLSEMSALFIVIAIGTAVISKINPNQFVKLFIDGAKKVLHAALIVGLARAIIVILESGMILDSLVYSMASTLEALPNFVATMGMYIFNLLFNLIVSSASGQAAIVMPVMTPLADVIGITRQVAVLAYNFGDGFTNTITPTSGILMASIALGGVSWVQWLRFMLPLLGLWCLIGAVALTIALQINLGPF